MPFYSQQQWQEADRTERPEASTPRPARPSQGAATGSADDRTERPTAPLRAGARAEDPLAKLRSRVSSLLAKDTRVEPQACQAALFASGQTNVPTAPQLMNRNYVAARRMAGPKLAWLCNYKHALHSGPTGCAHPELGGKWVIVDKDNVQSIKDDL